MKLITVVLRPALFDVLKEALALFGVRGMTVTQVYLSVGQPDRVQLYRGQRFASDLAPSLRVELLAGDDEAPDLAHIVDRVVAGDGTPLGIFWITRVDWLGRVRTGERGLDAL